MVQPPNPVPATIPDIPGARHLGDLARSDARWSVYLETKPQGTLATGRVHFVDGQRRRATGWIFLEASEADVLARFNEFSPVELWKIVESLPDAR
ncbi:MAG: hypothetical protein ACOY71_13915 [Gemmatimonadota bacterium]